MSAEESTDWRAMSTAAGGKSLADAARRVPTVLLVKTVVTPMGHVVFDIIPDVVQVVDATDDMVVIPWLPCKRYVVHVRISCDGRFQ